MSDVGQILNKIQDLNISKKFSGTKFKNADYMKYHGINYSIKINSIKDLSNKVIKYLKIHSFK